MTTEAQLKQVFDQIFQDTQKESDYQRTRYVKWNSLKHMALIFAIEEAFDITLSHDDMMTLDSFSTALAIVKRYAAQ